MPFKLYHFGAMKFSVVILLLMCTRVLPKLDCFKNPKVRADTMIVSGQTAEAGQIYWIVLLDFGDGICGGTLLHPNWVLTAGHCMFNYAGQTPRAGNDFQLVAGRVQKEEEFECEQKRRSELYISHEEFDTTALTSDIALVKAHKSFDITGYVKPASLPEPNLKFKRKKCLAVSGYGLLKECNGDPREFNKCTERYTAKALQVAVVPYYSHKKCKKILGPLINDSQRLIDRNTLCAGGSKADACAGDSGGPLVMTKDEQVFVVGVVSWGIGCARPDQPACYADVRKFVDWIKNNTNGDLEEITSLEISSFSRHDNVRDDLNTRRILGCRP